MLTWADEPDWLLRPENDSEAPAVPNSPVEDFDFPGFNYNDAFTEHVQIEVSQAVLWHS